MLTRIRLKLGSDTTARELDSSEVKNWDSLKYTLKRKDFGAVVRSFSTEFEFVGDAYDDILDEYLSNGMQAVGTLYVDMMNDRWGWELLFSADLDFSSISWNETTLSINCMDGSIASRINSKKSTKLEFSVSDLKEKAQLYYDRLIHYPRICSAGVCGDILPTTGIFPTGTTGYAMKVASGLSARKSKSDKTVDAGRECELLYFPKLRKISSDITGTMSFYDVNASNTVDGEGLDVYGQGTTNSQSLDASVFATALKTCSISARVKADINLFTTGGLNSVYVTRGGIGFSILKRTKYADGSSDLTYVVSRTENYTISKNGFSVDLYADANMSPGDSLLFAVVLQPFVYRNDSAAPYTGDVYITSKYQLQYEDVQTGAYARVDCTSDKEPLFYDPFMCDVISPESVLSAIVGEIAGTDIDTHIRFSKGSLLSGTMIVAAESIRGIADAKLYVTFSEFEKWMESVFGYICHIDDEQGLVEFVPRNEYFTSDIVKTVDSYSHELSVTVDTSSVYSAVSVGYEKQDYEEEYGRDEWRWTTAYTCKQIYQDNTLELISPFRCDCYGIEYIAADRRLAGSDDTDDNSDNDVFFIYCSYNAGKVRYEIERGRTEVAYTESETSMANADMMYNIEYSPYYMLKANEKYIAGLVGQIAFASCEGNSNITISDDDGDYDVTDDIELSGGYVTPNELSFSTDDIECPTDWRGLVEITSGAITYRGYIKEVEFAIGKETKTTYKLILKDIIK